MPSRRTFKHKKDYIQRPIGVAGGKLFRFTFTRQVCIPIGGGAKDATLRYLTPFDWQGIDTEFMTSIIPLVATPATLSQLLFETQFYNGPIQSGAWNTNGQTTKVSEAKHPDIFYYRYIAPVYYGINMRIHRARSVIATADATDYNPTTQDLQQSELSWQVPVDVFWRADYSNLNTFYPFYEGVSNDPTNGSFYNPKPGTFNDSTQAIVPTEVGTAVENLHEMLVQKRFSRCTISPTSDCVMKMGSHFKSLGLSGNMIDVKNTSVFTQNNMENVPVTIWLRQFFSNVGMPGQMSYSSKGMVPGDLYMVVKMPETNPLYSNIYRNPTSGSSAVAAGHGKVWLEGTITTSLILRAQELTPDIQPWGKTSGYSGLPTIA